MPALNANDRSVLDTLVGSTRPMSAYEILDRIRSNTVRAPMQIYRALQKLEERGLVHRIEAINAFVACSDHDDDCDKNDHSHPPHRPCFVICRDCGSVREFQDKRVRAVAAAAAGEGFLIDFVSVEVFGRCADCCGG